MMRLRPYQQDCCAAVEKSFSRDGLNRVLAVLATGAGKTVIFSRLTRYWINEQNARVLVLADRDELILQGVAKLASAAGLHAEVEKGDRQANVGASIVVSSIQTMSRRLAKWPPGSFSHIICDEAHLSMARNWQRVLKHFCGFHPDAELPLPQEAPRVFDNEGGVPRSVRILGVTATPFRADKKELCHFFEAIAYEHTCFDLIGEGYLSPLRVRVLPLRISLNDVATKGGDFEESSLARALEPHFEAIVSAIKEFAPGRRVLAFHPLCETSRKFVAVCERGGVRARHIDGESADRQDLLKAFGSADCSFQVLSNAALLCTGVDVERIDCILNLRPTKSVALYQQAIGRGTRVLPGIIDGLPDAATRRAAIAASAKPDCLVLDCLWDYERLGIQRPANLFARSAEEAEAITRKLEIARCDLDLVEVGADVIADREAELRRRLLANEKRRGRLFDAAAYAASVRANEALLDYEPVSAWEARPPTDPQLLTLEQAGITGVRYRGHATQIIQSIFDRRSRGLATPRQLRILVQNQVAGAERKTFREASEILEEIFGSKRREPLST